MSHEEVIDVLRHHVEDRHVRTLIGYAVGDVAPNDMHAEDFAAPMKLTGGEVALKAVGKAFEAPEYYVWHPVGIVRWVDGTAKETGKQAVSFLHSVVGTYPEYLVPVLREDTPAKDGDTTATAGHDTPDLTDVEPVTVTRALEEGEPCPECGHEFDPDEWHCQKPPSTPTLGETWKYRCPSCEKETCSIGT